MIVQIADINVNGGAPFPAIACDDDAQRTVSPARDWSMR